MEAKSLFLENFRNIEKQKIDFSSGVNVIWGENAQGKTNILEALWICSLGKSFRASNDKELISFEKQRAHIALEFYSEKREQIFEFIIKNQGRKEVTLNGVKKNKRSEILGEFNSVLFSPEHLNLVKDASSERRKFLDSAICRIYPNYADILNKFNKTLEQRNRLLKNIAEKKGSELQLDTWDEMLSISGAKIITLRLRYLKLLEYKASANHFDISGKQEKLTLDFITCVTDFKSSASIAEELLSLIKKNRKIDLIRGCTCVGPHRDDIDIKINGYSAKSFGSQGQQRSCVLSLKTAEAELLKEEYGEAPVLLLDDVLSELDSMRQSYILDKIESSQVIITCCDYESVNKYKNANLIHIVGGKCV